jgi:type I restriction-modification system DNA methylase subunit
VAGDGTTTVVIPAQAEFVDAAVEMSGVLRACKVEAPLRPKVIGSMVLAMSKGQIDAAPDQSLEQVNALVSTAIAEADGLAPDRKQELLDALKLSGADFNRLAPSIGRVANILRRLNVGAVIQSEADFLGTFYEAFLRYGYDNNALGIVFTPRHITHFCVELTGVTPADRVLDIACGTGGFLISAFDRMMSQAGNSPRAVAKVKRSLYGFDTNPTVWALAMLNMFFRGDGKSQIVCGSCFDQAARDSVREKFTRAYLNPPFSQEHEPERDFIDAALDALEPGGELAVVVKAGIFADDEHTAWRDELCRRHTPVAVISLPEDLFYPTAAPTSILIARAHHPLAADGRVLMARIWNDGFEKLKSRRVVCAGSQLPEIADALNRVGRGLDPDTPLATVTVGSDLAGGAS